MLQNVSFREDYKPLYDYVQKLAEDRYAGNFSQAIMDCILAHREASKVFGDWRDMTEVPPWARRVVRLAIEETKEGLPTERIE